MSATLKPIATEQGVKFATSVGDTHLYVLEKPQGTHVLRISKYHVDQLESTKPRVVTIEAASSSCSFGPLAALDSCEKYVIAALADRQRLCAFSVPQESCRISDDQSVHNLDFKGMLFALRPLPKRLYSGFSDVIAAVSTTGEIALVTASDRKPVLKQRNIKRLVLDRVLSVTTYNNDHLVVAALRASRLLFYTIRIGTGETLESLSVEAFPQVILPRPPRDAPSLRPKDGILGFAIRKDYAAVLYPGGYVHILGSSKHPTTPSAEVSFTTWWCLPKSGDSTPSSETSAILRHAFRLSRGRSVENTLSASKDSDSPREFGGLTALGSKFFAVGYGEHVSVWDGVYCAGHACVDTQGPLEYFVETVSSDTVYVTSREKIQKFRFTAESDPPSLTLGSAIERKGACDPIVISIEHNIERAPLGAQPVTVGPTQAAAESGGQIDRIFRRLMETEEENEVKQIRALLSRDSSPSPEAIIALTHPYFRYERKVRRGNFGDANDLGLAKLPSERLAAVSVARCIFEISCGNSAFVVPLIDMIGTGVVSSETVVSVLSVSDSWDMGPDTQSLVLSSICDPLITSVEYLNALEAILTRIADLPERDVVRVFHFAFRLTLKPESVSETKPLERVRLKRLVLKCMAYPVQQSRVVEVIKKLPFSDVIGCLGLLEEFLSEEDKLSRKQRQEVPTHIRLGQFKNGRITNEDALLYRGLGNWVDRDHAARMKTCRVDETELCATWISYLIDAHLTTFIMDSNGQQAASKILSLIRTRRKESQTLKGISGLVSHLIEQNPVADEQDPLYKVSNCQVPARMALQ